MYSNNIFVLITHPKMTIWQQRLKVSGTTDLPSENRRLKLERRKGEI